MINYNLYGLSNFIFDNIKKLLLTDKNNRGDCYKIQGIERRYLEKLLDCEYLAPIVHEKVVNKLTDKIADDIVNKIMFEIESQKISKNNDEF